MPDSLMAKMGALGKGAVDVTVGSGMPALGQKANKKEKQRSWAVRNVVLDNTAVYWFVQSLHIVDCTVLPQRVASSRCQRHCFRAGRAPTPAAPRANAASWHRSSGWSLGTCRRARAQVSRCAHRGEVRETASPSSCSQ